MVLGITGSFIGVCGIVTAAIITRHRKNGNGLVYKNTCEAKHDGLNKSLDALWGEFRILDEKIDKILLLVKG